jgi:hypothetical protein
MQLAAVGRGSTFATTTAPVNVVIDPQFAAADPPPLCLGPLFHPSDLVHRRHASPSLEAGARVDGCNRRGELRPGSPCSLGWRLAIAAAVAAVVACLEKGVVVGETQVRRDD